MEYQGTSFTATGSGTTSVQLPGKWAVPLHYVGTILIQVYVNTPATSSTLNVSITGFDYVFTFPMNEHTNIANVPQYLSINFNNYIGAIPQINVTPVTGPSQVWNIQVYVNKNV